ncbi:unnamed protein product [Didymodactylos carnosus]|uniref:Uncharacterized protein n=1 Tax=Didymodactylos carnosus TaxID=1234261 RepID=A0A815DJJ7_9BILA|nr:unnamed protein product [Didymodactylos carnosus]CAF4116660.1 unnamed protein product [Didymodactylos carnosus]
MFAALNELSRKCPHSFNDQLLSTNNNLSLLFHYKGSSKILSIHRLFEPLTLGECFGDMSINYYSCNISLPYLFICANGRQCILRLVIHDGVGNCDDLSYESALAPECTKSQFGIDPAQCVESFECKYLRGIIR